MWQGAREVSWIPTEFSLAFLEPFLTSTPPPPSPPFPPKKKKKPCQISEPASAPSILQGNGCHWALTPLIGRESVVLRSFAASLAYLCAVFASGHVWHEY